MNVKQRLFICSAAVLFGVLVLAVGLSLAQGPDEEVTGQAVLGTGFTYQGRLQKAGSPISATCHMAFRLYDKATDGSLIGTPLTRTVSVSGGLFTVSSLDFGSRAFNGQSRWLGIRVDCGGGYADLGREALSAAPYALYSRNGPFWSLSGNAATTPGTNFLGTSDNQALELKVNGARALRLEPNATSPNLIGGYSGNSVGAGVVGATIGGGGKSGSPNQASADYATVGGGYQNRTSAQEATVGGGYQNQASGLGATVAGGYANRASAQYATVAGGYNNKAITGTSATVGGGYGNQASGLYATVDGGNHNQARGDYATVTGGASNTAAGAYSFAAGWQAQANDNGAFVWAAHSGYVAGGIPSQRAYQFRVWADGGARFDVNNIRWVEFYDDGTDVISTSTGARLTVGGAWTNSSDRASKAHFTPVDGQALLARLAEVPVRTWNYTAEGTGIRHMGPVAQDFYAAFGLGDSDRSISTVDADGVTMAAVQALYKGAQAQANRIQALEAENTALQSRLDGLEARLAALEAGQGGRR